MDEREAHAAGSAGLFYAAFQASPIGIALENLEGQPLFVNPALCSMLGFSEEEMRGKHCVDFSPREDAEKDWALFEQLRAGSINHYQIDKRFFRRDGSLVWGRLSISLLSHTPPLIVAMVEDITEKKKAEEVRFLYAAIVESSGDAIVGTDVRGTITEWNKGAELLFGYSTSEALGNNISFLRAADRSEEGQRNLERVIRGEAVKPYETVGQRKDGTLVDISLTISPIVDAEGHVVGASGISRDITERKKAEEALSGMTRKLVEAQEQERARIARELHDDIGQRLAMLAIELGQVQARQETPSEVWNWARELSERVGELSKDIQALSHELHSSKLEYLGIVGGMKSWCNEFAVRQGMEVEFKSSGLPDSLPSEISLCLFRVLQEALHNAAKHSGQKRIEVEIQEEHGEIQLSVSDSGKGFDVAAAMQDRGLGVTSMQERVRLVGGTISIDSKPLAGTTIHVRVPLPPKTRAAKAGE